MEITVGLRLGSGNKLQRVFVRAWNFPSLVPTYIDSNVIDISSSYNVRLCERLGAGSQLLNRKGGLQLQAKAAPDTKSIGGAMQSLLLLQ
jgi:hypothetical protein